MRRAVLDAPLTAGCGRTKPTEGVDDDQLDAPHRGAGAGRARPAWCRRGARVRAAARPRPAGGQRRARPHGGATLPTPATTQAVDDGVQQFFNSNRRPTKSQDVLQHGAEFHRRWRAGQGRYAKDTTVKVSSVEQVSHERGRGDLHDHQGQPLAPSGDRRARERQVEGRGEDLCACSSWRVTSPAACDDKTITALPARERRRGRPPTSRGAALGTVLAVLFLTFLDTTIVSVTLGDLENDLSAGVIPLQWVINAYALVFASLMLLGGSLADRFGRKWVMLGGIVIFCVGSVMCAVASERRAGDHRPRASWASARRRRSRARCR